MNRSAFAFALSILILGIGATGCAVGATHTTTNSRALDQKILKLQPGMSVEEVQSSLGDPRLEKDLGEEEVLYYGLWQLVFTDQGLESWTRYYRSGWHRDTNIKALDRRVLRLQRGLSVEDVRKKLGTPEALQIYRNAPHKEESLWYGNGRWKLNFTNGKLLSKAKF